ncbi:hypothetical protein J2W42_006767 [Rhizobium tibeticum]|uniref:hypothetical protein n=1 Tax=Rhizobium tibeticum TaxID=501024 RepID=UPI00277FE23A|nr:hypothetical protein [Rhizobium tibeticum]MDP9813890.1 hypothetical protein [Rhizobium tibeticum]
MMRLTQRVRSFFREEAWGFPEHERPVVAGSPATPEHVLTLRIAYALVAILVGLIVSVTRNSDARHGADAGERPDRPSP